MKVLLIKTSSMGDLIHTLPALTDAMQAIPNIEFDWVAEESFQEIPAWHPAVKRVIPIAFRRWRKDVFTKSSYDGMQSLRQALNDTHYDIILDAQGLAKSAFIALLAKGKRVGLDWSSARESIASLVYQKKCHVNFQQHAIVRMRQLFSEALDYQLPTSAPEFAIKKTDFPQPSDEKSYLVFLHGTTWSSKQWPEEYWLQLAKMANAAGWRVKIGGGNTTEVARAERIAAQCEQVELIPYLSISAMAAQLAHASGAVAVDTGFGHLAGAINIPLVSIYGATDPQMTGVIGHQALNLSVDFPCAPCLLRDCTYKIDQNPLKPACYRTVAPEKVWTTLNKFLNEFKQ